MPGVRGELLIDDEKCRLEELECPADRRRAILFIRTAMRRGVLVDPIFLFIRHTVTTGHLSGGTRLVSGARERSVTEGFRSVAPPVGVPLVDDHFHRHDTAPDTAVALRIVGRHRQASLPALAINGQWRRHSIPWCRRRPLFPTIHQS